MSDIEVEPLDCAVDDRTYRIIQEWFGRDVSDKLLYKGDDTCGTYGNSGLKSMINRYGGGRS